MPANAGFKLDGFVIPCSDEITPLVAGNGLVTFRMPFAFILIEVRASLTVAQTAGSLLTVDINRNGTSILSTKITVDNTEKTSLSAASLPVITAAGRNLANDDEMTIDLDQIGDGTATGLKAYLIGFPVA